MTEAGQEPRRHHLVPNFYLERWAIQDRITVVDLEGGQRAFTIAPRNALFETDYYRIGKDDVVGGSPVVWEAWLSAIEGDAATAFEAIDRHGLGALSPEHHAQLLLFLGVQVARSRSYRLQGRWMSGPGYYRMWELDKPGALAAHIRLGGEDPTPERIAEVQAYFDMVNADPWRVPMSAVHEMESSMRGGTGLGEALWDRQLVMYRTVKPLLTCDEPVVMLHEHMGIDHHQDGGYFRAPIIVFPFGPHQILAMFRSNMPILREPTTDLTWSETLDLNRVIAGNAFRHLVELPEGKTGNLIRVPERKDPVRVVNLRDQSGREVVMTPLQRRWTGETDAPVRPVPAWWPARLPPAPKGPATAEEWTRERERYKSAEVPGGR